MLKPYLKAAWERLPLKLPMLRAIRATVPLPHRIYRHLHFRGDFDVEVAPGARFRIRSYANAVENDLFWTGYAGAWEGNSLALWRDLCPGMETILDVGANSGVYALAAAALCPETLVVAFEPVPRVADRLRTNAALNGDRIVVETVAVSDRDGTARLHDQEGDHAYSASLEYAMLAGAYTHSYDVPVVTLDGYCATRRIERVDLMKIDVERHEPQVMEGARRILEESRPALLVEILDREIGQAVADRIAGLGYRAYAVHDVERAGGVVPAEALGRAEHNYLLCQEETARRLGLPAAAPLG